MRNIGIVSAGETSLARHLLLRTGTLRWIAECTELDDWDWIDHRRITTWDGAVDVDSGGHRFTLVEVPDDVRSPAATELAQRTVDGLIVVVDAMAPLRPRDELLWLAFTFAVEAPLLHPLPADDFGIGLTLTPLMRRWF